MIGERERELQLPVGRWWYFEGRGGDGVIYLGILERGRFFFFFCSFLVGRRLVRENGDDIGFFFVQNRDLLYREVGNKREEEDR